MLAAGLDVNVIPNGGNVERFGPLPSNNALAESLSLINEEQVKETAGELR